MAEEKRGSASGYVVLMQQYGFMVPDKSSIFMGVFDNLVVEELPVGFSYTACATLWGDRGPCVIKQVLVGPSGTPIAEVPDQPVLLQGGRKTQQFAELHGFTLSELGHHEHRVFIDDQLVAVFPFEIFPKSVK